MAKPETPLIRADRLLLDELKLKDAHAMYLYRSSPEVMKYQTWHPASEQEVRAFIRTTNRAGFDTKDSWFQLGIYLETSQQLIGDLGIHFLPPDGRQLEIGATISPSHQHKGYATEAVKALLHFVFKDLKKHRVIASVDPKNAASIRLLEKIGMRKEGLFRQSVWTGKEWADDLRYALLEDEWAGKDK
jgi:RimJ/RimL family protein N-acetyltransferase